MSNFTVGADEWPQFGQTEAPSGMVFPHLEQNIVFPPVIKSELQVISLYSIL